MGANGSLTDCPDLFIYEQGFVGNFMASWYMLDLS